MAKTIQTVLEPEEQIVWQGVINRKVMAFYLFLSLLVVTAISAFLFSQETINYTSNNASKGIAGATVGIIFIAIGIFFSLLKFFSNLVVAYAITNKRVVIKSGLIGTDFNSIYFTEVRTVNVNVGLIDRAFSVGTINIDTGKIETVTSGTGKNRQTGTRTAYDKLLHVDNPYDVYKYFQTTLTERQESLYSGRADREDNPEDYKNQ